MGFVPFLKQNNGSVLIVKDNDGVWWFLDVTETWNPLFFSFKAALLFEEEEGEWEV